MIEALHRLLPSAQRIIPTAFHVTADNVIQALEESDVSFVIHRLGKTDWELESSEMDDIDILALLNMHEVGHQGLLLIETEACSTHGISYLSCPAERLGEFVSAYPANLELDDKTVGTFFDSDVIMLGETSRTLTIYHHGGAYCHVRLPAL